MILRRNLMLFFLFCLQTLILTGCVPPKPTAPPMTQLQVRQIQSRKYNTKDTRLIMKAVLNVLQDDGFIVKNAQLELGLLSAEKDVDVENKGQALFATLLSGQQARWAKHAVIEVSANVSEHGEETRVRVNFQRKTFNNVGVVSNITQIIDSAYYQQFFSKVSKGVFIQEEEL